MNRCLLLMAGLVAGLSALAAPVAATPAAARAPFVEGEAIVIFKPGTDLARARQILGGRGAEMKHHLPALSGSRGKQMTVARSNRTTAELLAELSREPEVELAEPNFILSAFGANLPSDPLGASQWALQNTGQPINGIYGVSGSDIRFADAWSLARPGGTPPVVAVIDTGVDYNHPDLKGNMWVNPGEIAGNGIDDDHDGYVDDVHGVNFMNGSGDPMDSGDHGSHISGTIAAVANNGVGVAGVCPKAKIMALRVSDDGGNTMPTDKILLAIDYTVAKRNAGVNVVAINASFGGGSYSQSFYDAIAAAGNAGILFCAAAGNDGTDNDVIPSYPASYSIPTLLSVAATDQNDNLAGFSNYGAGTVHLGAPGVNILSTVPAGLTSYVQTASVVYGGESFDFAVTTTGTTGAVVYCGLGNPAEFPAAVRGNIALISRGTLQFTEKLTNAKAAGALGAIIYNNVSGQIHGTLQYANTWIPVVGISEADGLDLQSRLPLQATVRSYKSTNDTYLYMDGTSMATPHVTAAAAFAALNFPQDTASERAQRILAAVDPIPQLAGMVQSGGRLNLLKMVDSDGNQLPDWWEQVYFGAVGGVSAADDPDQDGFSNLQEFLADTNPNEPQSALKLDLQSPDGKTHKLSWAAGTNSLLILERTATPTIAASWTSLWTNPPPHAASGVFTDPEATKSPYFYRLQAGRAIW